MSRRQLSQPVHNPQGSIVSEAGKISKKSHNNTMAQGRIASKTKKNLEQTQINTGHIPQESIVPDTFSWNAHNELVEKSQDEPEHFNDDDEVPDNLSMYSNDGDTDTLTARYVNDTGRHDGIHCDNCKGEIVGFRYTCVQCSYLDLCVACESQNAHSHHYMLRIPSPRPYDEIQTILMRIRRHLMRELDPMSSRDLDNEEATSVKSNIKSEYEEEFEQIDPLCENMPYDDDLKEYSTHFSPGSEHSENTVSEETLQDENPVLSQIKIVKVKGNTNETPLLRVSNNSESQCNTVSPSTTKRKIILSLAKLQKLKKCNYIAKKICLMPNKRSEEISIAPIQLSTKVPKPNVFNDIVKLRTLSTRTSKQQQLTKKICLMPDKRTEVMSIAPLKLTTRVPKPHVFKRIVKLRKLFSGTSKQQQLPSPVTTGRNLHMMPNNGKKETNIASKILTPKAVGPLSPVVKLSKLPQSILLQYERSGLIKVHPVNSLQKIVNTEGIR